MRNTSPAWRDFDWSLPVSLRDLSLALLFSVNALLSAGVEAQSLSTLDVDLFRSINNAQSPKSGLLDIVDVSSGPLFVIVPVVLVSSGIIGQNPEWTRAGALIGASQLLAGGSAVLLKMVTGRPRPFEALENVNLKHRSSATGSAFPSGHTALAFALATSASLCLENPYVSLPVFVWAGMVGYGRIYLGLHYPSDIVGGIVIGVASAWFVWQYRDEIGSFVERNLSIRQAEYDHSTSIPGLSTELIRLQIRLR